ncbi:MAG TPA: hypothetical protein VD996_10915 [Chitinophagaceae bacterium]|nr:hypothetical protein [Chitinophagaceae bacterium]
MKNANRSRCRLCIVLCLFISADCWSQAREQSLIVAEYRIDTPREGNFTYVVAYHFAGGHLRTKDTIAGFPTFREGDPGSYVRFDLGRNFIYKNRYVISGTGSVIDIKTRSLVIEESDDFIEARGDTLIFHRDNIFTGTGYLALNLRTKTYRFINNEKRDRNLIPSPNKKYHLYVDRSKVPYKIILKRKKAKDRVLINDAGNGPNLVGGVQFPNILTYWLNNDVFLYSVHKVIYPVKETVYSSVMLRTYNIKTGEDSLFAKLDSIITGRINDRVSKDAVERLIYRSSEGKRYVIDTALRLLQPDTSYQFGHGFTADNDFSPEYGLLIRYYGTEIGRWWSSVKAVTDGAIAIEYGEPGSNLGYPKGFKVWFNQTRQWSTVDIPWICSVIGWIDK